MTTIRTLRLVGALAVVALLGACAHPLSLEVVDTPMRNNDTLVAKKVGYVITDADRAKQVTTPGGGGDKVSYYPYRDVEKALRWALRSVYQDVTSMTSGSSAAAAHSAVVFVFTPVITTTSSSPSGLTWPPTQFSTEVARTVTDAQGAPVARFTVTGNGAAEFDEFKADHSLSARRAVMEAAEKFAQAVRADPKLK